MSSTEAKSSTQCHGEPGAYLHWAAIGDVNFTTEWQEFETDLKVAAEADGMKSIAFNLAEIKGACDYEITDFQWYLKDESLDEGMTYENLIDAEGTKNFFVKEGAGTAPYEFGHKPEEQQPVEGDVNGDGKVDVADISAILNHMAGTQDYSNSADVNGDGTVDVADISKVLDIMAAQARAKGIILGE